MEVESLTMDAEEQGLRDLGREADRNEGRPVQGDQSALKEPEIARPGEAKSSYAKATEDSSSKASATEDKPPDRGPSDVEEPEIKPDSSDLASDIKKRERDEKTGQFTPKSSSAKAPEDKQEKTETEY